MGRGKWNITVVADQKLSGSKIRRKKIVYQKCWTCLRLKFTYYLDYNIQKGLGTDFSIQILVRDLIFYFEME